MNSKWKAYIPLLLIWLWVMANNLAYTMGGHIHFLLPLALWIFIEQQRRDKTVVM